MSANDASLRSATTAVYARIARDIGQKIANGQILEGAFLPKEIELQVEFQASRQAVREALKFLAGRGMITARKRAGTSVNPRKDWDLLDSCVLSWHAAVSIPDEVLRDLVELRRVIEPLAITLTIQRADPKALVKIKNALDEMRIGITDRNLFYKADIAFHMSIYEASNNSLVRQLSTTIAQLLRISFERQKEAHEPLEQGYQTHAAVFRAIEAGDSAVACDAMHQLLDRAVTEIYRSKAPSCRTSRP